MVFQQRMKAAEYADGILRAPQFGKPPASFCEKAIVGGRTDRKRSRIAVNRRDITQAASWNLTQQIRPCEVTLGRTIDGEPGLALTCLLGKLVIFRRMVKIMGRQAEPPLPLRFRRGRNEVQSFSHNRTAASPRRFRSKRAVSHRSLRLTPACFHSVSCIC